MAVSTSCIICGKGGKLVPNPDIELIHDLLDYAKKRAMLGDVKLKDVADKLSSLSPAELAEVRYHRDCRKEVVSKDRLKRAEKRSMSESAVRPHSGPAKRGRPSSLGATGRSRRAKTVAPKEKVCVFTPCKWEGKDDLHQVLTSNRGEELLNIKKKTNNDHIRSCLSGLEEAGDAAAQEKYYHRNCMRDAHRTCIKSGGECALNSTSFKLHICDRLLVMSVQTSISTPGVVLTMNDINTEYLTILAENNIVTETQNHKRHLKPLLQEHIPEIEFVKSPRRNESEHVMLSKSLEDAVDSSLMNDPNVLLDNVMQVAQALRTEILNCREEWKFRGSLCNFTNPPLLQFFMTHLLFGSRSKSVCEKRDTEMSSTANILCQMVIQNIKTDRQVQHTPKSDVQFAKL